MTEYPTLALASCPACGATGSLVAFSDDTLPLISGSHVVQVEHLAGQRCAVCDEAFLDDDSQARFVAAGDALVEHARQEAGAQLRRVRRKLKLTQHEAAEIAGGGHNAFSRYESGRAQPVQAVFHLFHLLDKHPDLLGEIHNAHVTTRASADLATADAVIAGGKKGAVPKVGAPRQTAVPARR